MKEKNKKHLEKLIKKCLASGFPELDSDISQARDILDNLKGQTRGQLLKITSLIFSLYFALSMRISQD